MKLNRIFLVTVFISFMIGKVNAQCDTFKRVPGDAMEIHQIIFDPNNECIPHGGLVGPYTDPDPPNPDEVRRIYFIHGLGGSAKAWSKAAEACENKSLNIPGFPARKCETIRNDYTNSTISLYSAASDVRTAIANQANNDRDGGVLDPARAILIAHSQGGVVTRELMHLDMVQEPTHSSLVKGMNYGGVVMVASPLQGAQILANRNRIFEMANDGCNRVSLGPIADEIDNIDIVFDKPFKWIGPTVEKGVKNLLNKLLNNLLPKVCDMATDNIMPMFFKSYSAGITEDYNPVSTTNKISLLNNDANNAKYRDFPKMVFYAIEPQDYIFWRTLNWMLYDPNGDNGQNGPNVDYFGANDDWDLYNDIYDMKNSYRARMEQHYADYQRADYDVAVFTAWKDVYCDWWKILLNPLFYAPLCGWADGNRTDAIQRRIQEYDRYIKWSAGLDWFYSVDETWKSIIGARVQNGNTITYKDNDGVVLAESAANLPNATWQPIKIEATMTKKNGTGTVVVGSSHMQVRNDNGLKDHLNRLFNGEYDPWFKVFPKQ